MPAERSTRWLHTGLTKVTGRLMNVLTVRASPCQLRRRLAPNAAAEAKHTWSLFAVD